MSVRGFAVVTPARARAGIQLVADPALVPGSTPVAGAEVRLLSRPEGQLLMTTTTDATGAYSFGEVRVTHAAVELRTVPGAGLPDARQNLTLVLGNTVVVGAAGSARDQVVSQVRAAGLIPVGSLVLCTQNPLPAGTRIRSSRSAGTPVREVQGPGEWLLMIDPEPFAPMTHAVTYAYVEDGTGRIQTSAEESWPMLNEVLMWTTGDLIRFPGHPARFLSETADLTSFRPLEDIVQGGEDPFPDEGVPARHSTDPDAPIDSRDKFAFLWVGSAEAWFVQDAGRMYRWCLAQGIPKENIMIVMFTPPFSESAEFPVTYIDTTNFARDSIIVESRNALGEFNRKVRAAHVAGRHPSVFLWACSHGSPNGELLALNDRGVGLIRQGLFGDLYIPVEEVLPVATIPACKLRIALACCSALSHTLRWVQSLAPTDVDYAIATASGRRLSTGRNEELSKSGRPLTLFFNFDWTNGGATLSPSFELGFGPKTDASFAKFSGAIELNAHQPPASQRYNDRLLFDPNRPDPCVLPTPDPIPPESVVDLSQSSFSKSHTVGVSPCPDPIGTLTVTNPSSEEVQYSVTFGAGLIVQGPQAISLLPGQSFDLILSFDCSTQQSFGSFVRVRGQGIVTGTVEEKEANVTVTIQ